MAQEGRRGLNSQVDGKIAAGLMPSVGGFDERVKASVILEYALGAAAAGVLGNLTTDAIKIAFKSGGRALGQARSRGKQNPPAPAGDRLLLAKLAVQARCGQIGFNVPSIESLTVIQVERHGATVLYQLVAPSLKARVTVPAGSLKDGSIKVTVYTTR